ncbi:DedA family protein [Saccharomonospora xinjiangensis]|uniref:Putative membrane-associated protein n=1 Tax=Saccharomonospora xinjiangensis XJ-54 TaxID=882086 RepID=I0V1L0_9PSEU|nr:VTT domain-containing protein [Saccharomonospora xinjiangensis]EID54013.1 putative membrane-associated protein [Saccharomonospora xinjiangensis XJ-54]
MFEWLDSLMTNLAGLTGSPWLWVVVFAVAALDALAPFMPSEGTVMAVAVLLGPDPAALALLAVVAAGGALAGDVAGHGIGRLAGPRTLQRVLGRDKGRRRYEWAKAAIHRHATAVVIAARYVPGGRVAAGLATGSVGFPLRRFVALDAVGAAVWACYAVVVGSVAGAAFSAPAVAMLVAIGTGFVAVGVAEVVRRVLSARDVSHVTNHRPTGLGPTMTSDNGNPCRNASTSSPSVAPTARASSPGSRPSSPRSEGGSSRPPTTPTPTRAGSSPGRR